MTRMLLALAIIVAVADPARADALDLHRLYDRGKAFVGSLIGAEPDYEVIAPPVSVDRGMIIAPPASGALRNILPHGDRPVRPD